VVTTYGLPTCYTGPFQGPAYHAAHWYFQKHREFGYRHPAEQADGWPAIRVRWPAKMYAEYCEWVDTARHLTAPEGYDFTQPRYLHTGDPL
jgi:hypothetical protein